MVDPGYRTKAVLQIWRHIGWIVWPLVLFIIVTTYFKQPQLINVRFVLVGIATGAIIHGMIIILYKAFSKDLDLT